jgi:hypothetical protein
MGSPPESVDDMKASVRAALQDDPGFLIDVEADFTNPAVTGTITLTALGSDVDLTGHTLYIALVQQEDEYEEEHYHWIFRDAQDTLPQLGNISAGTPAEYTIDLTRGDWDLDFLTVIAFVQNDSDKSILQAGSTEVDAPTKTGSSADNSQMHSSPGGIR